MAQRLTLLRRISIGLCIVGGLISGYLTWTHITSSSVQCIGGSNQCDVVQQSTYSSVAGVPVALLGLIGYLAILGLLIIEERGAQIGEYAPLLIFGMTLVGVAYSAYLTYIEIAIIDAICQYCVASAVIMTVLFAIAVYRLAVTTRE
jgi:uncharacterized membrane protein